jgi:hypothetical protein
METTPIIFAATDIAHRLQTQLAASGIEQTITAAAVHATMRRQGQTPSTLNKYPWPNDEQQSRIRELSANPRA